MLETIPIHFRKYAEMIGNPIDISNNPALKHIRDNYQNLAKPDNANPGSIQGDA
jgi:hypothetical protein